jgi:hypothetical protein
LPNGGETVRNTWTVILFLVATACLATARPDIDVSGTWTGEISGQSGGRGNVRFVLKQTAGQISGTAGPSDKQNPPQIYDGKLQGDHLSFAADDTDDSGLKLIYHFDLAVSGDRIEGKANGRSGDRSWTLEVFVTRDK